MEELEAILTTQTFKEAGGKEEHPGLEIGGIVSAYLYGTLSFSDAVSKLNEKLAKDAKMNEYTHVFGVRYSSDPSQDTTEESVHRVVGTGYKQKK